MRTFTESPVHFIVKELPSDKDSPPAGAVTLVGMGSDPVPFVEAEGFVSWNLHEEINTKIASDNISSLCMFPQILIRKTSVLSKFNKIHYFYSYFSFRKCA